MSVKWEVYMKCFCCTPKYDGYLKEEHLGNSLSFKIWVTKLNYPPTPPHFHGLPWKNKWLIPCGWLFRLECLADIFSRMSIAYYLKENNGQYLLSMIKFRLSNKSKNFWKLVSATMTLTASWYLEIFLMRLVVVVVFLISYDEMCQNLEDLHNPVNWQFPNDLMHDITKLRICWNCKLDQ